ncbi:hypothetical protein L7F22_054081 [Adiantum nelumboides]|nr:hypothetical protein [Adiantum nelumboides]
MAKVPYSSAVDSLMYAMVATRPDIAFAVGVVSCYMANPGRKHWDAVKHLLRYLKGIASKCLRFGNSEASIVGYTDVIMQVVQTHESPFWLCISLCRSNSFMKISTPDMHIFSYNRVRICCSSSASKEAVWLARLVGDLGIHQILVLYCDSQSAITLAKNPMFYSKTKHIEVRYHVV